MIAYQSKAQWRPGPITNASINDITLNSGLLNSLFAVGNNGYLSYYTAGQGWQTIYVPDSSNLQAIDFPSTYTGYIGSYNGLMKTTPYGAIRWVKIPSNGMSDITGLDFVTNDIGWVCTDNGVIGRTIDGGMHWDTTQFNNIYFKKIHFTDLKHGWVVGTTTTESIVFKTSNGGITWEEETAISSSSYCVDVEFTDALTGYITLGDGSLYKTIDAGNTWTLISTIPSTTTFNVAFSTTTSDGYALTNSGIIKTTDSGLTWQLVSTIQARSLCFIDNSNVVVGNNFGVLNITNDGGTTWSSTNTAVLNGENLYGVKFLDQLNGYIVGNGGLIRYSNDGGHTWVNDNSPVSTPLYAVESSPSHVWAVGLNGKIAKKTSGTWNLLTSGTTETLLSVDFIDDNIGIVVGTNGKILRTSDGGTTWTNISSGIPFNLRSVHFVNSSVGYITGINNSFLKTINGGLSWTPISQSVYNGLSFLSICFIDIQNGIACGTNGEILKTSDGGITWNIIPNPVSGVVLYSVHFSSNLEGWIAGNNGTLLHTIDGGNTWYNNSLTNYSNQPLNSITSFNGKLYTVGNGMSYFQYDENCSGALAPVNFTETEELNNCVGSSEGSVLLASGTGVMSWYDAPVGGNYLGSGNIFVTPANLTVNTTYYVQDSTCITSSRTPITVTVSSIIPTATVTAQDNVLSTQETGVLYQWINCDENTFISGETGQNFTATTYANYAVLVNLNGCVTQSSCTPVSFVGINESSIENEFEMYPNPVSSILNVNIKENSSGIIRIHTAEGLLVLEDTFETSSIKIDVSSFSSGIYYIEVISEGKQTTKKVQF